jgi:hypothetical protein
MIAQQSKRRILTMIF